MSEIKSSATHREMAAEAIESVAIGLVTVSDSRTPETDTNAIFLRGELEQEGHTITSYQIVPDEPEQIEIVLEEMVESSARIIIFNGGTGITPRDRTFDVIDRKLEKRLTGFGEIFRMLSYDQVGAAAMLSRATAGTYKGKLIISTPGAPQAVKLAWDKLIKPELQHLAWEIIR
ncbi:molybdenum cofactor biosynthesis protein [Candidatus Poribacteria bacterium]|nr:molybdenum cofactor biosynthesis protein [Candidatus Poribacteria bacterium]OUT55795.1 MAG: molybdenum cofactor biosynthesis protein [bacterium TMED15]